MSFDQGEFNFDTPGSEQGYINWRQELDERRRAFESRWGLVLGHRTQVVLHGYEKPQEGIIRLACDERLAFTKHLKLQINGIIFTHQDIQSLVRIE